MNLGNGIFLNSWMKHIIYNEIIIVIIVINFHSLNNMPSKYKKIKCALKYNSAGTASKE